MLLDVDDGTPDRPYPHAIVAGVARYPLKVHKKMPQKKIAKRSRVKPFIKAVNYNHIMPTRYNLDLADGLKQIVTVDTLADDGKRVEARKAVKKAFEERYASGKNPYFFKRELFVVNHSGSSFADIRPSHFSSPVLDILYTWSRKRAIE